VLHEAAPGAHGLGERGEIGARRFAQKEISLRPDQAQAANRFSRLRRKSSGA